jgi:hypothetical protein
MNRCAIVTTHHKTGTAWMNSTFRDICAALNIRYLQLGKEKKITEEDAKAPVVFFSMNSDFRNTPWLIENPEHRVFHLIRDPRDIVISGAHYHRVAKEKWLHNPRAAFGGKTYQQQINSLPNNRQRYIFEMNNGTKNTINNIEMWDYERENSFECKYEKLIDDVDMSLFSQIVTHLGFDDNELETCRACFWKNSLFGDKQDGKNKTIHIRSGSAEQWREVFDRPLARTFTKQFGDVLIRLGYEPNDQWVKKLGSKLSSAQEKTSERAMDLEATE